jgi:hypothetical protein
VVIQHPRILPLASPITLRVHLPTLRATFSVRLIASMPAPRFRRHHARAIYPESFGTNGCQCTVLHGYRSADAPGTEQSAGDRFSRPDIQHHGDRRLLRLQQQRELECRARTRRLAVDSHRLCSARRACSLAQGSERGLIKPELAYIAPNRSRRRRKIRPSNFSGERARK